MLLYGSTYGEPVGTATEQPIIVSQSTPYTQILLQ
jgi:hypothetical protein